MTTEQDGTPEHCATPGRAEEGDDACADEADDAFADEADDAQPAIASSAETPTSAVPWRARPVIG
jgi:hypothetical protein